MTEPSYIRRLRILAGLSLSDAAAQIGVSPSHLSMAERGARTLGEQNIIALADLYNLDPNVASLAGGHVPAWVREQFRTRPEEAACAAMDGFGRYSSDKRTENQEAPSDGER